MKCLNEVMPLSTTVAISSNTCSPHQVIAMWKEKSQAALEVLLSHICSASSSDWPGAGRQKSTTIVVPPDSAARVPLSKSSAE